MIAAQLLAAHNATMERYRRAMIPEQTVEGRSENLNQANKLSRTYVVLLDALNRHRGKGQQNYFTWRNTKHKLTDYLTELTTTDVKEFFRPNFFVNTPDINPYFLQTSGRAGFLIRAVLAATLSGLWGVYSGFELCESAPLPGREEYHDSEKYQIRVRDQNAPGNIVFEIAILNRLRRAHPVLQSHLGVRFYNAFNDQILLYGKMSSSREDMILIAVSLDPHHVQEADFELPLWERKLPDHGSLRVEDLIGGHTSGWGGKLEAGGRDAGALAHAIWRLVPPERAP